MQHTEIMCQAHKGLLGGTDLRGALQVMARGGAGRAQVFPDETCVVGFLCRFLFLVEASIIE